MSSISSSIPNNHLLSTYCVSNTLKRAPGTYSRTLADGRGTAETPSWGPLEHQITVDSQCMGTDKGGDTPQTQGNSKLPAGLVVIGVEAMNAYPVSVWGRVELETDCHWLQLQDAEERDGGKRGTVSIFQSPGTYIISFNLHNPMRQGWLFPFYR